MNSNDLLIVDDHAGVRATLRKWLAAALPRLAVFEAANGEEALEFVRRHSPCLVLMDLFLPGISGIETTRAIKRASPATLVVIVSVDEAPNHRCAAAEAGASGYVAKERMGFELVPMLERLLPQLGRPRRPVA